MEILLESLFVLMLAAGVGFNLAADRLERKCEALRAARLTPRRSPGDVLALYPWGRLTGCFENLDYVCFLAHFEARTTADLHPDFSIFGESVKNRLDPPVLTTLAGPAHWERLFDPPIRHSVDAPVSILAPAPCEVACRADAGAAADDGHDEIVIAACLYWREVYDKNAFAAVDCKPGVGGGLLLNAPLPALKHEAPQGQEHPQHPHAPLKQLDPPLGEKSRDSVHDGTLPRREAAEQS